MRSITLPGTSLQVSRLSFGTASLHHLPTSKQRQALLREANDKGFTHFDTSPYYGYGVAEAELGKAFSSKQGTTTIASKIGLYPHGSSATASFGVWWKKGLGLLNKAYSNPVRDWSLRSAQASLDQTLRTLRRSYVDILFLHEPDATLVNREELLEWLQSQERLGKVKYWGLAGQVDTFVPLLEENHPLACVVQIRDSVLSPKTTLLTKLGRKAQFTYGYLGTAKQAGIDISETLRRALSLNTTGSIIVSTRRAKRLSQIISIAP